MKLVIALLIAAMLAVPAASSQATEPGKIVAAKRALARAVYGKANGGLIRARAQFESMAKAEPDSALLHYWIAVADWRLVPRLDEDKKQAQRYCKDGLMHAEQALKIDPGSAEAMAVKAGLQGLGVRLDPQNMMTLGMAMMQTNGRALLMAPENPRVVFIDALNTLHKPAFVGGGPDKALPKFEKSIELFAKETVTDSTAADWGHDDAYIWAGRTAMQLKDYAAARGFYEKALEINADNGWVKNTLLPEAKKAQSGKGAAKDSL